jgi:hypothetical protein
MPRTDINPSRSALLGDNQGVLVSPIYITINIIRVARKPPQGERAP